VWVRTHTSSPDASDDEVNAVTGDEQTGRAALIDAYRQVVDMGLTDQASGNLSCRVAGGMLISCSGATADNLTPERVVMVRDDGGWDGDVQPSSEWRMHQVSDGQRRRVQLAYGLMIPYSVSFFFNHRTRYEQLV